MSMLVSYTAGVKGHFKASGREFVIVATSSLTSTIRFRYDQDTPANRVEIADSELRELVDNGWPSDET